MTKRWSQEAVRQYREDGYFHPIDVLSREEVATRRERLERFEQAQGHPITGPQRSKTHLLFTWLDELMRDPRVLDPIEDLIGEDILCWNTAFWIKEPQTETFVSWHQDLTYWGLDDDSMITAWLALSPATAESGCMRVLPGSHRGEMMPHDEKYHEDNMLTRGQEIALEVDEARAVAMALQPGQMSIHNVRLAHTSSANTSDDRRIGISMHFMPTSARQMLADWDSAALVRGVDRYHHFAEPPRPRRDMDPEALAFHAKASDALREILYKGAAQATDRL